MAEAPAEVVALQKDLSALVPACESNDDASWSRLEEIARAIADNLRARNEGSDDVHTLLGKTDLPQTLAALIKSTTHQSVIPETSRTVPAIELLRISANVCMDHDENRSQLLEAGLPQVIVSLLEGYAESIPEEITGIPLPFSNSHLKVIRTAVGALLNASLGHDPVKTRLNSLEASITLMKLSANIYPPGAWLSSQSDESSWDIRRGISSWAWRTISELKDSKEETIPTFGPSVLPFLTPPLAFYTVPFPDWKPQFSPDSPIYAALLQADFEALEESCTLLESLSLDVEDIRLSLARGFQFNSEHNGVPCLAIILEFIQNGGYSPLWRLCPAIGEAERKRKEKSLDMCKAALIKSVVEVAGEEHNEDVLWDESDPTKPGGVFVCQMIDWLKAYVKCGEARAGPMVGRDDLVICASLSLGNLTRREKQTTILLSQPHSLASVVTSTHLLSPEADIKMKHGVIGLLKNLAQSSLQSPELSATLYKANVIQRICECGVWDAKTDAMAEVVQVSAIGVVKHLCNTNLDCAFATVLPSPGATRPPGLAQILALVKRSDSVPVKSEGTRVLVNVVKSLWSNGSVASPVIGTNPIVNGTVDSSLQEIPRKMNASLRVVLTQECANALAGLVGRSAKYGLLVNEGVVALSLLSTQRVGAPLVLKALVQSLRLELPVPPTEPPSASSSTRSDISSPVVETPMLRPDENLPFTETPLDMLVSVMKNVDISFQPEVRMNVCSLLVQVSRNNVPNEDLERVKDSLKPVLQQVLENLKDAEGKEGQVATQVKKVLDMWT